MKRVVAAALAPRVRQRPHGQARRRSVVNGIPRGSLTVR